MSPLPIPPLPLNSLPPTLPSPLHSPSLIALSIGPLNPARESGGARPSGVWGGAPAEIEFGAF